MKKRVVVIGGVACGPKAASRIKRLMPHAEVTIIEKNEILSYAGCGLPYYIAGEVRDHSELMSTPAGVVRDTHFFRAVKDITVVNRTVAERIDRKTKEVHAVSTLTGERRVFPYDELVLAVGSRTIQPPIPGVELKGVNFLSTVEDARKIRDQEGSLEGKHAVIIGAGLIGVEVTEAFVRQGMKVRIVEQTEHLLENLVDPEIAFHLKNEMLQKGVALNLKDRAKEILGDDQGRVRTVVTEQGSYPADMVLIAVGVRPEIRLAEEAGLEIGPLGGIRVDSHMRTSDPSIYAGGDCVENTSRVTGKPVYAPMGSTANKHGRVIADNICGRPTRFPGVLGTAIVRIFDLSLARTGLTEKETGQEELSVVTALSPAPDRAHFLPSAKVIIIKLIAENPSGRIVGCQVVGYGDVAKRIEVAVTSMSHGGTVMDLGNYDLAYAPPFSPAMDNIIVAANIAENKINDIGHGITPSEVRTRMEEGDDFIFLDVRSPEEFEQIRIEDERVRLVPLGKLREQIETIPKDKEIITFCKISLRGYEAQRILDGAGYAKVRYMDGGVVAWPYKKFVAS
ncbi:FAD-dependent oxidoreductase [Desulfobotulus sp. H1]|uniref:FAD-dependent oxidoreductase n=1 Tax=Desulfobotulus pelophilus TaxID=2823377 RepID=A0ABT3N913_9BACT|nr:FAD-dependent oxidoreductase [Desulfobotulus pelophilus]MCW7753950.1 FAD-dependent oxidoreductase [Desulfobotulus pelophilus]